MNNFLHLQIEPELICQCPITKKKTDNDKKVHHTNNVYFYNIMPNNIKDKEKYNEKSLKSI